MARWRDGENVLMAPDFRSSGLCLGLEGKRTSEDLNVSKLVRA
jgi:hypothetical protein